MILIDWARHLLPGFALWKPKPTAENYDDRLLSVVAPLPETNEVLAKLNKINVQASQTATPAATDEVTYLQDRGLSANRND